MLFTQILCPTYKIWGISWPVCIFKNRDLWKHLSNSLSVHLFVCPIIHVLFQIALLHLSELSFSLFFPISIISASVIALKTVIKKYLPSKKQTWFWCFKTSWYFLLHYITLHKFKVNPNVWPWQLVLSWSRSSWSID